MSFWLSRAMAVGPGLAFVRWRLAFGSFRHSFQEWWHDGRADQRLPVSWLDRRARHTTPTIDRVVVTQITVTDPHHPLFGQSFPVADRTTRTDRVAVSLPDGRRRLLRRTATDLESAACTQACLVPLISVRTLLPLAVYIYAGLTSSIQEESDANSYPIKRSLPRSPGCADANSQRAPSPVAELTSGEQATIGPANRSVAATPAALVCKLTELKRES